jgi:hypothetical protein
MSGLPTPRHGSGASRTGHAMQSGRQQGQLAGCVVARGAVHDAMASIVVRAARRAASKSSMSGAIASTIALATRSTYSGAARIAGSLSATCAQNVPKAALQRPAKGPRLAARAHRPPGTAAPRSATGRSVRPGRGFGPHPVLRGLVEARAEGEGEMTRWLNFGTAALAFAAAVFCFVGLREASELQAYRDKTPADDPFYTALIASAKMNRIAALFSGLSALCAGVNALRQRA